MRSVLTEIMIGRRRNREKEIEAEDSFDSVISENVFEKSKTNKI